MKSVKSKHILRIICYLGVILVAFGVAYLGIGLFVHPQKGILVNAQPVAKDESKEAISLVALGDSLTEGVGDTTERGGFVPLVATEVKDYFKLNAIDTENFGKSGDRSDQILKRLKKSEEQQTALTTADIVTITVGGNDLMKTVSANLFGKLSLNTFMTPASKYQRQLTDLIAEIRQYAPSAPIYIFGIYNPFYLYFSEITELQEIVNYWNGKTEEVVDSATDCFFLPINDLLYKGSQGNQAVEDENSEDEGLTVDSSAATASTETTSTTSGIEETTESTTESQAKGTLASSDAAALEAALGGLVSTSGSANDLIFDEDHFHPNNLGYQKMAGVLRDELIQTQGLWLKDDGAK